MLVGQTVLRSSVSSHLKESTVRLSFLLTDGGREDPRKEGDGHREECYPLSPRLLPASKCFHVS